MGFYDDHVPKQLKQGRSVSQSYFSPRVFSCFCTRQGARGELLVRSKYSVCLPNYQCTSLETVERSL